MVGVAWWGELFPIVGRGWESSDPSDELLRVLWWRGGFGCLLYVRVGLFFGASGSMGEEGPEGLPGKMALNARPRSCSKCNFDARSHTRAIRHGITHLPPVVGAWRATSG